MTDRFSTARLDAVGEPDPYEGAAGFTVGRVLAVIAVLAMAIWWVYVFVNTDSIAHPDEFDDPAWSADAEAICADAQQQVIDLGNPLAVTTPQERGELVAAGTAVLDQMLIDLRALGLPDHETGRVTIPAWLDDYDLYLQDRRNWTEILATGHDPAFVVSGNADGVRVTDLLRTVAEVNAMPNCAPIPDA